MSKSRESYSSIGHHPVHVYGDSDVRLAYLEKGNRITARALVWPEKMVHSRIYGDESRMSRTLKLAGYVRGSLGGAKLKRINLPRGRVLAPYFDDEGHRGRVEDDYITPDEDGDWSFEGTEGFVDAEPEDNTFLCDSCGDSYDEDDVSQYRTADTNEVWCESCANEYGYRCDASGELYASSDDFVNVYRRRGSDPEEWHVNETDQPGYYRCDETCDYYRESVFPSFTLEDGRVVCSEWFEDNGITIDGRHYEHGKEPDDPDQGTLDLTVDTLPLPTYSVPVTLLTADPDITHNRHWQAIHDLDGCVKHFSVYSPGGYRGITYLGRFNSIEEAIELEPVS